MKFRAGFVSNSSSSSYVVMATKELHDKILAEMSEFEREAMQIFESAASKTKAKKFGKELVILAYLTGNMGDYLYDEIVGNDKFKAFCEKHDAGTDHVMQASEVYYKAVEKSADGWVHSENC